MSPEQSDLVVAPKPELACTVSPERMAVLDLDRLGEPALILTGSGRDVWLLIDGRRSLGEIVAALAAAHPDDDRNAIATSIESFMKELLRRGVIIEAGTARRD